MLGRESGKRPHEQTQSQAWPLALIVQRKRREALHVQEDDIADGQERNDHYSGIIL